MSNKLVKKGKPYFRFLKNIMRVRYKPTRFVYLGEQFPDGSLVLSNHEGTDAPMALEMYLDRNFRLWGAHEMNSGLKLLYSYQTRVYYHEKKHWNIHLARLFCLIASPLTNLFYSGLDLISTYRDVRVVKTLKESLQTVEDGKSVVVFPEISENGYLPELEGFHEGFAVFAEFCMKRRNLDLPIVVSYYQKTKNTYIFDKPVFYSELVRTYGTREAIVEHLLARCNELGKIDADAPTSPVAEQQETEQKVV